MKSKRTFALVAVLAALTIAAPATQAGTSPDDRPGTHGIGPTAAAISVSPDDRSGARGTGTTGLGSETSADDRPGTHGIGPSPVTLSPDDRLGPRGDTVAQARPPATIIVRPGGFDWADAGIGAATMLGAGLLAAGLILVGRRRSLAQPA